MSIELIRGELERLYSLEEMMALASELLGFEPADLGGTASPASFARALTTHCQQQDAIAALIDAVTTCKEQASPNLHKFVDDVLRAPVEIKPGSELGGHKVVRRLGRGPNGTVYLTKLGDDRRVLKLLHASAVHDRSSLHRFLTRTRLMAKVEHPSLPDGLAAGFIDGKPFVEYLAVEAKPLAARVGRTGALHINEARALVHGILGGLQALHQARLVHGAVKLENVLVTKNEDGSPRVLLVDAGGDLLSSSWVHSDVATTGGNRIKGLAPEQLKGLGTTAQSDLYGFGALLFELLTGKPPLDESTATELAVAHLSKEPPKASDLAPRGWVSDELSKLCSQLLSKNPAHRPSIDEVLEIIGAPQSRKGTIDEAELNDCIDNLVADPTDAEAAIALEVTVDRGAEPRKVAEAFLMAADQLNPDEAAQACRGEGESEAIAEAQAEAAGDRAREQKRRLIFRAARLFEQQLKDFAKAEDAYKWLLELAPTDEVAKSGLENALRAEDKLDELVEHLLAIGEKSDNHSERGLALNKIGHLYIGPLEDREQACFAFAQAVAQEVQNEDFAADLEKAAGHDMSCWAEAMRTLHQVSEHPRLPQEARIALFMRLGRWYSEKIARPDLAVPCFDTVLKLDPAHQGALEGMSGVYRRAQQWNELVTVLLTRVERAPTPALARDLRTQAAEILETRLDDLARARELYEQTLAEDPGHQKTVDALASIYMRHEDYLGFVKILEQQASALTGQLLAETLCRIGEIYEDRLAEPAEAERKYQAALESDAHSMTAIRALDQLYSRAERFQELLDNLDRQVALAATPRQKIKLFERIAAIHDEEFLNHEKAAEALEQVLELDAGHEGALTALMRHYRALDRWDDVIDLYDRSLRVCSDEAQRAQLLLAQGRVLLDFGSPERARLAYEHVLQLQPGNASALESLAHVRAATGDAMAALSAVESLAEKAETPTQKAELWLRAARILEDHGDRDGAIGRYKLALDAEPTSHEAMELLRGAYLARGDATAAIELIGLQIKQTEGKLAQAKLWTDLAELRRSKISDQAGAKDAATKAVDLDPTNTGAVLILGDLAFEGGSFNEAATHYGALSTRTDVLDQDVAKIMLMRYIDALARTGSTGQAQNAVKALLDLAPDDPAALRRAGRVLLDAGDFPGSVEIYAKVHDEFGESLAPEDRASSLLNYGKALRLNGDVDAALSPLMDAADLMPEDVTPINELASAYAAQGLWEEVVATKQRRLDLAEGDERANLLLEIGEVLASEIKDATRAAKTFVAALEERPDSRKVLTRMMKLYSEEKDWSKLVDVVLKLGEGVDDPKQKAKYVHTAAGVSARQIGDLDGAIGYLDEVLQLDPDNEKALEESIEFREQAGDHEGMVRFLRLALEKAEQADDQPTIVATLDRIAHISHTKLGDTDGAIGLLERSQELDPDNSERAEQLAALYAGDSEKFLDKAAAAQMALVRKDPFNAAGYRQLRKLYTDAKQADPAWCVCQALHAMNVAEPDEERFYRRMRPETAAEAKERVTEAEWARALLHEDLDSVVTRIFQLIEPAVLAKNTQPLEALGFSRQYALDLSMHPYPMSQTLYYAAGVLGMDIPLTFQNPNDPGGLSFLHAQPPSIVLGQAALAAELPTQAAAFIAARHLTYFRSGLYIRHLVPTGTGMRSWLFAAIRMVHDTFPIAAELEAMVGANVEALRALLHGPDRDKLASAVSKLIQSGAIDLKKWVGAVDLSADRAGFLVCHDLEIAHEMIKAADESATAVPHRERIKELTLFSVDPKYMAIRRRLSITIDT